MGEIPASVWLSITLVLVSVIGNWFVFRYKVNDLIVSQKKLTEKMSDQHSDMHKRIDEIKDNYVRRDDYKDHIDRQDKQYEKIETSIQKMDEKIDRLIARKQPV